MTKTVTFKVGMSCDGCKGAITRILSKIEGSNLIPNAFIHTIISIFIELVCLVQVLAK